MEKKTVLDVTEYEPIVNPFENKLVFMRVGASQVECIEIQLDERQFRLFVHEVLFECSLEYRERAHHGEKGYWEKRDPKHPRRVE